MKTSRHRHSLRLALFSVLTLAALYGFWAIKQPLPLLAPTTSSATLQTITTTSSLAWPNAQSAVGIVGTPAIQKSGLQIPAATASTAKIITALTVLKQKPLDLNQQGPTITLTSSDVDIYNRYIEQDGSVIPVQAGEKISEYQALQAMLLPSANNIADSLAIWAYGSLEDYATAANAYVSDLGLTSTHVGSDASGLSPDSVSTAQDLVKLGELAMDNPVLAQIASQTNATDIPLTTTIRNVNSLLGTSNIVGLKTGNSDQAGGVFVSASKTTVGGKPLTIVTAVMGTPDLNSALTSSLTLIRSAQANFSSQAIISNPNDVLGAYPLPWGGSVNAVASKAFSVDIVKGTAIKPKVKLGPIAATTKAGQTVGEVTAGGNTISDQSSIPVVMKTAVPLPSIWWRLTHPIQ